MPVIIPLLATGYLLTIYLLLMLAQRTLKNSRYIANSVTDTYAPFLPAEHLARTEELERWSRRFGGTTSKELPPELYSAALTTSPPQKIREASSPLT